MSQPVALYRKYRSRSLDELIGQEHVTQTLKQALKKQAISHAYLLTGPRGVGKTSTARIVAHAVNDLPYKDDTARHLDIIEIDAASNRRIEEIRELREKIHVAPSALRYKVYIIDEVHMLTNEAFNALLKTLEEPPEHAIFILATTEVHKLPATIVSRTQQFSFRPLKAEQMSSHLQHIASNEGIDITEEATLSLAEHAQGSFRDAISLLDQIAGASHNDKKIEADDVYQLVGLVSRNAIDSLSTLILNGDDVAKVFNDVDQLHERGVSMGTIAHQLALQLRTKLSELEASRQYEALSLIQELLHAQSSVDPKLKLQTTLAMFISKRASTDGQEELSSGSEPKASKPKHRPVTPKKSPAPKNETETTPVAPPVRDVKSISPEIVLNAWSDIMAAVKEDHTTLHAVLRQAQPMEEEGRLYLNFQYPLHMRKTQKPANFDKLNSVIQGVAGGVVEITCRLRKPESSSVKIDESDTPPNDKESSMLEKLRGTLGGDIVQLS